MITRKPFPHQDIFLQTFWILQSYSRTLIGQALFVWAFSLYSGLASPWNTVNVFTPLYPWPRYSPPFWYHLQKAAHSNEYPNLRRGLTVASSLPGGVGDPEGSRGNTQSNLSIRRSLKSQSSPFLQNKLNNARSRVTL